MSEIILDSVIDSIKLLPFLFSYFICLWNGWSIRQVRQHERESVQPEKFGPVWGGLLGVIPQCGFSAAASSLFCRTCDHSGNFDRGVSVYFR